MNFLAHCSNGWNTATVLLDRGDSGASASKKFERVLFFLCLALVFYFGGSTPRVNAQLYYLSVPLFLKSFAWRTFVSDCGFIPALFAASAH